MIIRNPDVLETIRKAVFGGMVAAAAEVLAPEIRRRLLAQDSPPASKPGEAPHHGSEDSADGEPHLADTVMVWPLEDQDEVQVGSPSPKALALELGTAVMAPRPVWLDAAIVMLGEMADTLEEKAGTLLEGGIQETITDANVNPNSTESAKIPTSVAGGKNP